MIGHVQLLGHRLQAAGDLRHLLHPVVAAAAGGGPDQLQIVDDDEAEAVLALEPPRPGAQRRHGDAGRVVDEEGQPRQLLRGVHEFREILLAHLAAADAVAGDARVLGQDAGGQLLRRHFQREERHLGALLDLDAAGVVATSSR